MADHQAKVNVVIKVRARTGKAEMCGAVHHTDDNGNRIHVRTHGVTRNGEAMSPVRSGGPLTNITPNRDSTGPLNLQRYPTSAPLPIPVTLSLSDCQSLSAKETTSFYSVHFLGLELPLWPLRLWLATFVFTSHGRQTMLALQFSKHIFQMQFNEVTLLWTILLQLQPWSSNATPMRSAW